MSVGWAAAVKVASSPILLELAVWWQNRDGATNRRLDSPCHTRAMLNGPAGANRIAVHGKRKADEKVLASG